MNQRNVPFDVGLFSHTLSLPPCLTRVSDDSDRDVSLAAAVHAQVGCNSCCSGLHRV